LRQKLEYRDQIETKEMTPGIILTRVIVTATSHCHYHVARRQLDTWQNFYFFKKIQKSKIKKIKKNQKKIKKKI